MTAQEKHVMPDVPEPDFVGSLCEIWSGINYAAYHLAYVRVYLQTAALQTDVEKLRQQKQAIREFTQTDVLICRAHLAARGVSQPRNNISRIVGNSEVILGEPDRKLDRC